MLVYEGFHLVIVDHLLQGIAAQGREERGEGGHTGHIDVEG
jgi:hypothetical protein